MRYIEFYLENFKGVRKLQLTIDKRNKNPIPLVGLNESGKTTVLEGINRIGERVKGYTETEDTKEKLLRANEELQSNAIIPRTTQGYFSDDITLACTLKDRNSTYRIKYIYTIKNNELREIRTLLEINTREITKTEDKRQELLKIRDAAPLVWLYSDFIFNIPTTINFVRSQKIPSLEETANTSLKNIETYKKYVGTELNRDWQQILDDILITYQKDNEYEFQKNVVDYLDNNPVGRANYNNILSAVARTINEKIIDTWEKISKEKKIKEISFKEDTIADITSDAYRSYSITVKTQKNREFDIRERSLGFRWFFSFILHTEFRKLRHKNTLFLLDEPASNLHAAAQEQILKSINTLSRDVNVIYSTHSPYLIDISNLSNIHITKNIAEDKEEGTDITCERFSKETREKNGDLRPLLDYVHFKLPVIMERYFNEDGTTNEEAGKKIERDIGRDNVPLLKRLINATYLAHDLTEKITKFVDYLHTII